MIWRILANPGDDRLRIARRANRRGSGRHGRVKRGKGGAVNLGIWEERLVQQVHQLDVTIGIPLHDRSLKDLNRKAEELKRARHRVTEGLDAAPVIEVIEEFGIVDGESGLGVEPSGRT